LAYFVLVRKTRQDCYKVEGFEGNKIHTFAVIIPAHNEELGISRTLNSCAVIDYPREKFKIFVIADNCSDRTADIARTFNATVLEREDKEKTGKGFALEWAFRQEFWKEYDATILLDADCIIDRIALEVFDYHLTKGSKVLQANDVASNPDISPISYLVAVGNFIENELFYTPKSDLGLSVFLRGTGVVISHDILIKYPWKANSLVEDLEYSLDLIRAGVRVQFVREASVRSQFPEMFSELNVQRTRWAKGSFSVGKAMGWKLIKEGFASKKLLVVDAGWTLFINSRPLVFLQLFLTLLAATVCQVVLKDAASFYILLAALFVFTAQVSYVLLGFLMMGLSQHRILLLLRTPLAMLDLTAISVRAWLQTGHAKWIRTPRRK
jgi:cellulose synthase/poly-beta-1,6-N-acetylglucosamine synthase-like glycosyltransferase